MKYLSILFILPFILVNLSDGTDSRQEAVKSIDDIMAQVSTSKKDVNQVLKFVSDFLVKSPNEAKSIQQQLQKILTVYSVEQRLSNLKWTIPTTFSELRTMIVDMKKNNSYFTSENDFVFALLATNIINKMKTADPHFLPSFDLNLVIVHPIVHTIIRLYIISENEYPNDLKRLSSDVMSYAIKSKTIQIHLNVSEHVQFIRLFSKPNSCVSNKESGNFEQNLCGIYAQTLTALPVDHSFISEPFYDNIRQSMVKIQLSYNTLVEKFPDEIAIELSEPLMLKSYVNLASQLQVDIYRSLLGGMRADTPARKAILNASICDNLIILLAAGFVKNADKITIAEKVGIAEVYSIAFAKAGKCEKFRGNEIEQLYKKFLRKYDITPMLSRSFTEAATDSERTCQLLTHLRKDSDGHLRINNSPGFWDVLKVNENDDEISKKYLQTVFFNCNNDIRTLFTNHVHDALKSVNENKLIFSDLTDIIKVAISSSSSPILTEENVLDIHEMVLMHTIRDIEIGKLSDAVNKLDQLYTQFFPSYKNSVFSKPPIRGAQNKLFSTDHDVKLRNVLAIILGQFGADKVLLHQKPDLELCHLALKWTLYLVISLPSNIKIDAQRIENILKTFELVLIHSNGDNTMEDDSLLTVFLIFFKRFEPQIRSAIKKSTDILKLEKVTFDVKDASHYVRLVSYYLTIYLIDDDTESDSKKPQEAHQSSAVDNSSNDAKLKAFNLLLDYNSCLPLFWKDVAIPPTTIDLFTKLISKNSVEIGKFEMQRAPHGMNLEDLRSRAVSLNERFIIIANILIAVNDPGWKTYTINALQTIYAAYLELPNNAFPLNLKSSAVEKMKNVVDFGDYLRGDSTDKSNLYTEFVTRFQKTLA